MVTRALEKYIRISPKKLAPIGRLVSKKKVEEAINILANTNKKGALILKTAIESALNNAKRLPDKKFTEADLYISKVVVNGGPALKRFRAMSMGRAGTIRKRTSHVLVELDAMEQSGEKVKKAVKTGKKK